MQSISRVSINPRIRGLKLTPQAMILPILNNGKNARLTAIYPVMMSRINLVQLEARLSTCRTVGCWPLLATITRKPEVFKSNVYSPHNTMFIYNKISALPRYEVITNNDIRRKQVTFPRA